MESIYNSKYGAGRKITAAQYLTEFICERQAKREKKVLTTKFWDTDDWNKIFRAQITHANKLLKEHTCLEIVNALKSKRGLSLYSLGNIKPIKNIIASQNKIRGAQVSMIVIDEYNELFNDDAVVEVVEKVTVKPNLWEKLN